MHFTAWNDIEMHIDCTRTVLHDLKFENSDTAPMRLQNADLVQWIFICSAFEAVQCSESVALLYSNHYSAVHAGY